MAPNYPQSQIAEGTWQSHNCSQNGDLYESHPDIPPKGPDNRRKSVEKPPLLCNILGKSFEPIDKFYASGPKLGQGVTGVVRQCVDKKSCVSLACKTFAKSELKDRLSVKDLRSEIAGLRTVGSHPGVVSLKDTFEDEKSVHLVMELCEGGELFERIKQRSRYTEREAALVCRTVASVLAYCHSKGVMHRDIKPENIFLVSKGSDVDVKVGDFGLCAFFHAGVRLQRRVGSPFYIAPEVLNENYGPEADLWSLGVVLYIMLCGVPPFPGNTQEQIFERIKRGEVNMERGPWKEISFEAKDLVTRLLCADPELRITAGQVKGHPWIKRHCFLTSLAPPKSYFPEASNPEAVPCKGPQTPGSSNPQSSPPSRQSSSCGTPRSHGKAPFNSLVPGEAHPPSPISINQETRRRAGYPLSHVARSSGRRRSIDFSPVCVPSISRPRRHSIEVGGGDKGAESENLRLAGMVGDYLSAMSPASVRDTEEETKRLLRLLSGDSDMSLGSPACMEPKSVWAEPEMIFEAGM